MSEKELGMEIGYNLNYGEDVDLLIFDSARALLAAGRVELAYGLSKLINGGYEKTDLTILLAGFLIDSERVESALALLAEASESSLTASELWQQSELLCKIARITSVAGSESVARTYLEKATEIARRGERNGSSQDRIDSSSVLGEIAELYSSFGDQDEALKLASSIANEGKRNSALSRLANPNS